MYENRAYYLIKQYYTQSLSDQEWIELEALFHTEDPKILDAAFIRLMKEEINHDVGEVDEAHLQQRISEILQVDVQEQPRSSDQPIRLQRMSKLTRSMWFSIAAILVLVGFLAVLFYPKNPNETLSTAAVDTVVTDLLPGQDGGILSFENGKTIDLSNLPEGKTTLRSYDNIAIEVERTNATYALIQDKPTASLIYQEIETPKGRRFRVNLSDGSRIWLNAGSKLRFPIQFDSEKREVYLSGEAYFEVAHQADRPFRVKFKNMDSSVEVLGTKFNINNYPENQEITTTLIEGKVQIINQHNTRMLAPGDVAVATSDGSIRHFTNSSASNSLAWKDNYFQFNEADIKTVMTELGRWYNFEVDYAGKLPAEKYSGKIGKDLTLNQVMEILAGTNIRYKVINKNRIRIYAD
ncbi:FecR family protein [Sphingobacterium lactis]|uniref:FecR protein n=1 Tax=Sphingobacterium lactis TaxID=797291 RepID=A0A1H5XRX9_9SPHI|nr:FecR family protein [Sphingobacterium lactis]SEG14275.1 protein of unknown function [Sphingobacterium lactis]